LCKSKSNSVNLINFDNPYDKYLIPIYPVLVYKIKIIEKSKNK